MVRIVLAGLGVLIAVLVIRAATVFTKVDGTFQTLTPMVADACERLDIAPGTEDVEIDEATGRVYVSAADRRQWYNEGGSKAAPGAKNGIYMFDIDDPATLRKVSPDEMTDFLPHGISHWRGESGVERLFVVNHPSTGEEIVEIFAIREDGSLDHRESISFDEMYSPNDVTGVGLRKFYATNDRRFESGLLGLAELYLALPLTSVVYFDGAEGRYAAKGLAYANGINQSADGRTIYVAEFLNRKIVPFTRTIKTGALSKRIARSVDTGPDNIDVAADGRLFIAGHSKATQFVKHAEDPSATAPSHVVVLEPTNGKQEDLFVSLDGEINGSSVAAAGLGKMIVGAVFDGHVMICPADV